MKNIDAINHVRGTSIFLDDIPLQQGTLFAAVFDSPVAHGILKHIDLKNAQKAAWGTFKASAKSSCSTTLPDTEKLEKDSIGTTAL